MSIRTETDGGAAGFVAFFRRYARTWLHGVSSAALTAFGVLAVVDRWFVVVAIAAYVLPPVALYATGRGPAAGAAAAPPTDARTEEVDPGSGVGRTNHAHPGSEADGTSDDDPGPDDGDGVGDPGTPTDRTGDGGPGPGGDGVDDAWTAVDVPTDAGLRDVAIADGRAFAVGDDGTVLTDAGGDGWHVLLADGPGAAGQSLAGVDATADGSAVWLAGDGGSLARMDAATGRHVDHSAPLDVTDSWTDVAVAGPAGDEVVLLTTGSGTVLRGRYRDGEAAWDDQRSPGSGSSIAGVDLADARTGHCCDTNDGVFETADGGASFERVGVDGADGTPTDVASRATGACAVATDGGVVHRLEEGVWTPERVGEAAIAALDRRAGRAVACAGRAVYERAGATGTWTRRLTPARADLTGVALGADRAVAVGDEGTVVERRGSLGSP